MAVCIEQISAVETYDSAADEEDPLQAPSQKLLKDLTVEKFLFESKLVGLTDSWRLNQNGRWQRILKI